MPIVGDKLFFWHLHSFWNSASRKFHLVGNPILYLIKIPGLNIDYFNRSIVSKGKLSTNVIGNLTTWKPTIAHDTQRQLTIGVNKIDSSGMM